MPTKPLRSTRCARIARRWRSSRASADSRRASASPKLGRDLGAWVSGVDRQNDARFQAPSRSVAEDDFPSMSVNDRLRDSESKPYPTCGAPAAGLVEPMIRTEYANQSLGGNARTTVSDADAPRRLIAGEPDLGCRSVFDGVVDQVG